MRAFLIDFENVKSAGLVGIDTLGIDDQVVILYSANSNTISFEMHQKIMSCAANVEYYQIRRGGKNSLDFQLSSLLGYLLASGLYSHLYIVSNDSGFDALYDFWTSQYIPTDCVVYRRPNIALAVSHSLFSGKTAELENGSEEIDEVDVTVDDSGAYDAFELTQEDVPVYIDAQEIPDETDPEEETSEESDSFETVNEENTEEESSEIDDAETAAILGVLQAVHEEEQRKADTHDEEYVSAAARMRKAELDAEEDVKMILPVVPSEESSGSGENEDRPRRRRGRSRRSEPEKETSSSVQSASETNKGKNHADPDEAAALSARLESELGDLCNRDQRMAVAETILLSEGKQEFYRSIIRRFGQKKGILVYKAVKSDFSALKKS